MNYEYKFYKIELGGVFVGKPKENHHAIIAQHAKNGWRLVQIFAPAVYGYGAAKYFELIFERPMK